MNYTLECLEKFEELSPELKEVFGGEKAYNLINDLEYQHGVDLAFVLVLLAIDELKISDLPEYLKNKYKLSPEKANLIVKEIESKILEPANEVISEMNEKNVMEKISVDDLILSIFSENLFLVFSYSQEEVKNFNIASFAAFNEDDMLEEKVIDAFYNNQELISDKKIKIEDKEKPATVANFLKDFIKTHGSEIPNNLVLANYLNNSHNVKKLNKTEKDILNRVLKTYRNLVFFPESMEGVPTELWEIIPVKGSQEVFDVLGDDKESDFNKNLKKKISDNKKTKNLKSKEEENRKKQAREKELENIKKSSVSQLEEMLKDYSPNSLGYKAIKQELNKLKKAKKK